MQRIGQAVIASALLVVSCSVPAQVALVRDITAGGSSRLRY